ncbi:protein kinase [Marinicella sediminis]|uniref:Protein kinase n=1 Tax=Marinicella sediminis TaxID=1792834 RepID=A0ABV7JKQ1_9GAMM|nr:serine/threonine-protein kinase [Marinicella sediminis]
MITDIAKWKKVKPIFESLFDYPLPVALKKLHAMTDLSEEEQSAVRRLLFGVHTKDTLMDTNAQDLFKQHLQQGNDLSGEQLGEYHLLKLISRGGMSSIYLAERTDGSIQKKVAIKVMAGWQVSDASKELFNHEQTILSRLRHPNIITMHHGGVSDDGLFYMVMDYVANGVPFDQYVKQQGLSQREIILLCLKVARAISYAHGNLVIHRDLKASNILIDDNHHVVVVDFGIASSEHQHEDAGLRVYTPEIASPEQILGQDISVVTDVFSLAATTLTQLLQTPALPNIDPQNYDPQVDRDHIDQLLQEASMSHELKLIFRQALAIDPADRYESMDHFAEDLDYWLHNKPISLLSDSRTYLVKKLVSRNRLVTAFAALALLVLLVSLVMVSNFAHNAYQAANRADASLAFVTNILNQADPFMARNGQVTIKEVLDANHDIPLEQVNGDLTLKEELHRKLGEIYIKLGLLDEALVQFEQAVAMQQSLYPETDQLTLKTRNVLASIYLALGRVDAAIVTSDAVLSAHQAAGLQDDNVVAEAKMNLLQAYGSFAGRNIHDQARFEQLLPELIDAADEQLLTDIDVKVNVMSRLAIEVQKTQDYDRAERYFTESLALLEETEGKLNFDYQLIFHDYAIAKIRQKQHQQAEDMLLQIIADIGAIDPLNSLLGRTWETYSSLLLRTDRPQQAIKALDQATRIFEESDNHNGLYYALSKRAMYHFELFNYLPGLMDQLRFIPDLLKSAGPGSPVVTASLGHLMMMLHAADENDLANQVMVALQADVGLMESQQANLMAYLAYGAISNWVDGGIDQALTTQAYLHEYNKKPDASLYQLLDYLVSGDELHSFTVAQYFSEEDIKHSFINRVRLLQRLNQSDSSETVNDQQLDQLCVVDRAFVRFRQIEMKQLFLTACEQAYQRAGRSSPDELLRTQGQLADAVAAFNHQSRQDIRQQTRAILASLSANGRPPDAVH